MSDCCGGGKRNVLLYSCSGAANVAEVADLAARRLMAEGEGMMWCLAAVGANIEVLVDKARGADLSLVLDGCPMDCAKKILDNAGIENAVQIKVTDLGIEKSKGVRATEEQVERVVLRAKEVLGE